MRAAAALPLADILETDWDATLFRGPKALANQLGWTSYHTLRSKGSKSGYPDRTLVRDRILFVELKRENTKPTGDQVVWLDRLATAGGETYLWRPSDLDEIGLILSTRWKWMPRTFEFERSVLARVDHTNQGTKSSGAWQPASLWIPGLGRSDTQEQQTLLTTKGALA